MKIKPEVVVDFKHIRREALEGFVIGSVLLATLATIAVFLTVTKLLVYFLEGVLFGIVATLLGLAVKFVYKEIFTNAQ